MTRRLLIAARRLPTRHLAAMVQRAVPVLLEVTRHFVGTVVVLLSVTLIILPIPLSNVAPALVIALIALAYLDDDGLLLSIALVAGFALLAVEGAVVWESIRGAKWMSRFW